MKRRKFLKSTAAYVTLAGISIPSISFSSVKARILKQEVSGANRPYKYRRIGDPTKSAPTRRIERFELRSGECQLGDCVARPGPRGPQTSARVEKHVVTNLKEGDVGQLSYYIYFPSEEYNFLPRVLTSTGQIYLYDKPSEHWGGGPLWMMESDPGSKRIFVKISKFYFEDGNLQSDTLRRYEIGKLGGSIPLDNWNQIVVDFKLSRQKDGWLRTFLNGQQVMSYKGPTAANGIVAGTSYGIYQVRTNQYPGGAKVIPPQVVYYSAVQLRKQ